MLFNQGISPNRPLKKAAPLTPPTPYKQSQPTYKGMLSLLFLSLLANSETKSTLRSALPTQKNFLRHSAGEECIGYKDYAGALECDQKTVYDAQGLPARIFTNYAWAPDTGITTAATMADNRGNQYIGYKEDNNTISFDQLIHQHPGQNRTEIFREGRSEGTHLFAKSYTRQTIDGHVFEIKEDYHKYSIGSTIYLDASRVTSMEHRFIWLNYSLVHQKQNSWVSYIDQNGNKYTSSSELEKSLKKSSSERTHSAPKEIKITQLRRHPLIDNETATEPLNRNSLAKKEIMVLFLFVTYMLLTSHVASKGSEKKPEGKAHIV